MATPLVSIIVPTKNSATTLERCLDSIKKQTYKPIETIVVDNFSNDSTPVIAQHYADSFYSKGPERSAQRNFAVSKARGDYVCIIDSDMELDPDVIKQCVDAVREKDSIVGVVVPEESFGVGFWARCKQLERSFYVGVAYMEAARFFKRSDFLKLGGYNTDMISGEDWDFSQRAEALGALSRTTSFIRHNEGKISLMKTIRKKFYYAQKFRSYKSANSGTVKTGLQTSIVNRYRLFFSNPRRLFKQPLLGLGMLFMKTCEFGFGAAGYITATLKYR